MFIRFYYQKLEENKWRFTIQFFFPLYNVLCAFYYFIQISTDAVRWINILCGAIDRNDQPVQPTLHGFLCSRIIQVMRICTGSCINAFVMGIFYHVQKVSVQVGLSLEIENQIKQFLMYLINCFAEKILLQHSCRSCKSPETAWTFRAAQVATRRWFKGNGNRISPLYGLFGQLSGIESCKQFNAIPHSAKSELTHQVQGIVQVEIRHKGKGN